MRVAAQRPRGRDRRESNRLDQGRVLVRRRLQERARPRPLLFLPKRARPLSTRGVPSERPVRDRASSQEIQPEPRIDSVVKTGRALIFPSTRARTSAGIRSSVCRGRTASADLPHTDVSMAPGSRADSRSLARSVKTYRQKTVASRIGVSFGATTAFPLIALEDRVKVAVLLCRRDAPIGNCRRKPTRSTTSLASPCRSSWWAGGTTTWFPFEGRRRSRCSSGELCRPIKSGTWSSTADISTSQERDHSRSAAVARPLRAGP